MPPVDWQLIVVLVCVAGAAFVVARRIWRMTRPAAAGQAPAACGACGSCGTRAAATHADASRSFIPIDSLTNAAAADKRS